MSAGSLHAPDQILEKSLESTKQRYAVGRWESLWPNEPYMSHRIVLDRVNRTVIAGQDRRLTRWTSMREDDRA
jgi:hypothetical protein